MIVIDVETTGLDPKKNSIVSIGAVDFSNSECQFYQECKIREYTEISDDALAINGFSREQITNPNKKSLEQIMADLIKWMEPIEDKTIAGENPSFDRDFLNDAIERYNLYKRLGHRTIDLHSLAYSHHLRRGMHIPLKNERTDINTDKILIYVGLPSEPKPHNALTGAKMEAEAFSRLIYGKSLLEEFKHFPIPEYLYLPRY